MPSTLRAANFAAKASVTPPSGTAWSNLNNVNGSTANSASSSMGKNGNSETLRVTNYAFDAGGDAVPVDAIINGVVVRIHIASTGNSTYDNALHLFHNNNPVGNNKARSNAPANMWPIRLSDAETITYGGNLDTWGVSGIDGAMVRDPSFGAGFSVDNQASANRTAHVYTFEIEVWWDPPPTPPTPTGLNLTAIDHQSMNVSWNASGGATSYNFRWSVNSNMSGATTITNIGNSPQVVSGLPSNSTIYGDIEACNAHGCSARSGVQNTTTPVAPPGVPTGLDVIDIETDEARYVWNSVSGADSYIVQRRVKPEG